MQTMRDDVTLLAKTNRIGPEKDAREPNAAELECLVRTKAVIPERVVNGADEARDEEDRGDGGDGKMRRQKPNEHTKGEHVIGQVERGNKSRPILPKTDRVDPFDQDVVCRWPFRRRTGITVPRPVQNRLAISGV